MNLTITVETDKGPQTFAVNTDGVTYVTSMRVDINGDPIVVIPFHMHGATPIHTVCVLGSDEIETVEW